MKKTGQLLKESREKQRISIAEVSKATKIGGRVLQAMEEGDDEELPQVTFLRGFVRTYAQYLKLDIHLVMSTFNEEMGAPPLQSRPVEEKKSDQVGWLEQLPFLKDRSAAIKSLSALAVVVLIVFIIFIKGIIDRYESEKSLDPPTKLSANLENLPSPDPEPEGAFVETEAEPKPEVEASSPPPPPPEPVIKEVESSQELIIEALDSVVVNFQADNGKKERISMAPEEVQTIRAKKTIELEFSDGGSISLVFNGKDKGVPGELGKPLKVRFP